MKFALIIYTLLKATLHRAITNLTPGFTYQQAVDSVAQLPQDASNGDLYIVKDEDNKRYVYDEASQSYLPLGTAITTAQIDSLYT